MIRRRHTPIRPLWPCRVDAQPWPCATARLVLVYRYGLDARALRVEMRRMLYVAAHDLHRLDPAAVPSPADLFNRFIALTLGRG